jgi:hypothetical protein
VQARALPEETGSGARGRTLAQTSAGVGQRIEELDLDRFTR